MGRLERVAILLAAAGSMREATSHGGGDRWTACNKVLQPGSNIATDSGTCSHFPQHAESKILNAFQLPRTALLFVGALPNG